MTIERTRWTEKKAIDIYPRHFDDAFLTVKGRTDAKAARGLTPSERRAKELDMKIVEAVRKDVIQCNVYDGIT